MEEEIIIPGEIEPKNKLSNGKILLISTIFLFLLLSGALFALYNQFKTISKEGVECLKEPSVYNQKILQPKYPQNDVVCGCSLKEKGYMEKQEYILPNWTIPN